MFIGHFAVSLAAKRVSPRTSLGTLIMAGECLDLIWPILVLTGIEKVEIQPGNTVVTPLAFVYYPYSHSLLMACVWATIFASVYFALKRYLKGAVVIWVAVVSHWVLDVFAHRPDMPLYPGGHTFLGFGLWNSLPATVAVEGLMFLIGILLYLSVSKSADRTGVYAFWGFVVFLLAVYVANILGPPPPNFRIVAWAGVFMWLLVAWGFWIDRHRRSEIPSMS
jgi:hypothetical protein